MSSKASSSVPPLREGFYVLPGNCAFLLVPEAGFPLGRALDDLLAYIVRRYPLGGPSGQPLVPAAEIRRPEDPLGERHLALYELLVYRGYRVPDAIVTAAARLAAVDDPAHQPPFLLPSVRRAWKARIDGWEAALMELRELLARYTPPSSRSLFADPDDRSALNDALLRFLALVVDAEAGGVVVSLVPRVKWPPGLAKEGEAWKDAHPSAPSMSLNPPTSDWW